tara:strand:+ start:392 stop:619 length:228 start_codon:yes stop_codon:yes gene_type:complete
MKNYYTVLLLSFSIIIAAFIISFSNRYKPSPINESFVIDSWTGNIYDIQGNNLTEIHKNLNPSKTQKNPNFNKIQ